MEEGDDMPKIVFTPEEERHIAMLVEAQRRIKRNEEVPVNGWIIGSIVGFLIVVIIMLSGC